MRQKIVIGTRTSNLALWQADFVADKIKNAFPHIDITLYPIITTGDKILDMPLARIGSKGLFTQELENSILSRKIDMAVHSLKDMPVELPDGLSIGAVVNRENPKDGLISPRYKSIDRLPYGAKVGTSSLRRRAQLLYHRPDLHICDLRGNVDTRLRKLVIEELDAIILAVSGLKRLGWQNQVTQELPFELFLPAAGQGVLAIETRTQDDEILNVLKVLQDDPTFKAITAERSFLQVVEGGCQVPIGVYAECNRQTLSIQAIILDAEGKKAIRAKVEGNSADAAQIGSDLASSMLEEGGRELLNISRLRRK